MRRSTTDAERQAIRTQAEAGRSPSAIADSLGMDPRTVRYHVESMGLGPLPVKLHRSDYVRLGRKVKGFTAEEDAAIERLSVDGIANKSIGRKLGELFPGRQRPHNSVRRRLQVLAQLAEAGEE